MSNLIIALLFIFNFSYAYTKYNLSIEITDKLLKGKALIISDKPLDIDTKRLKIISQKEKNGIIEIIYKKELLAFEKNDKEIYLTDFYPFVNDITIYNFKVKLPQGFIPIAPAEDIKKEDGWYIFKNPYPMYSLVLIARKDYKITVLERRGIKIYGYFFKNENNKLLKKAKKYIKLYENMFGKFPYKRFSIVETSYPYGFSFPTFTTINSYIINKPYIIDKSLAHEILHQWFGCSVYVDYRKGNWSEGLVSFYSNYKLSKDKRLYRKTAIQKYEAFYKEDKPLSDFIYKEDKKAEALGYAKGMFIFYLLSNLIGEKTLNSALREFYEKNKFRKASWEDIKRFIKKYQNKNVDKFFNQWVYKGYVPEFSIKLLKTYYNKDHFEISFKIFQKEDFETQIPIYIKTPFSLEKKVVNVKTKEEKVLLKSKYRPVRIYIDPNYQIFRRLSDEEYDPLIYNFLSKNDLIIEPKSIREVENKNAVFYDSKNSILKSLIGNKNLSNNPFVKTFKNPLGLKKTITLINNLPERLIKHYGNYSDVILKDRKIIKKRKRNDFKNYFDVYGENNYISINKGTITFKDLIENIKDKRAIFIGENHQSFENHISQLEIIKAIYKNNKKIVIGMEMFQKPFQKYLDKYIDGEIDEKTMLLKTQYYKRWGYDYNLYRPIINFAKENKIRLVALNAPSEIIEKVSKNGLQSLKNVPKIDFSNLEYRNYLKKIFNMHSTGKKFINFYESQLLWDETMAQTASNYAKDYTVIVLAGNGHLRYRYGIPSRFERETGINAVVILNDDEIKPKIANFVIENQEIDYKENTKLGVYLKKTQHGLKVENVIKNSLAEKIGLKKGDIILAYNEYKIDEVWKLKTFLTFFKNTDKLKIKRGNKILIISMY